MGDSPLCGSGEELGVCVVGETHLVDDLPLPMRAADDVGETGLVVPVLSCVRLEILPVRNTNNGDVKIF